VKIEKVEAIIRPFKLDEVKITTMQVLSETVSGSPGGRRATERRYRVVDIPLRKTKVEIAVE